MKKSEFDSYNIKYFDDTSIKKVSKKYSRKNEFRYLWAYLSPQYCKMKIKIKADNTFYKEIGNYIYNYELFLLIDKCCIEDSEEDLSILASAKTILKILIDNYWDLDEVCISSLDYEWIICINHNFEIFLVGNKIINYFNSIIKNERIADCIILFE